MYGNAEDQVGTIFIEGLKITVDIASKVAGGTTKGVGALLIAAYQGRKNRDLKVFGEENLKKLLTSGEDLEVFMFKQRDIEGFEKGAKEYGFPYSYIQKGNGPDDLCEVYVKKTDAPKISRVIDKYELNTVDMGTIETEISNDKEGNTHEAPVRNDAEKIMEELSPKEEGRAKPQLNKAVQKESRSQSNPEAAKTANPRPSEPSLNSKSKSDRVASMTSRPKPSVKEELRDIKATQMKSEADEPKRDDRDAKDTTKSKSSSSMQRQTQNNQHRQNHKSRKPKGRAEK